MKLLKYIKYFIENTSPTTFDYDVVIELSKLLEAIKNLLIHEIFSQSRDAKTLTYTDDVLFAVVRSVMSDTNASFAHSEGLRMKLSFKSGLLSIKKKSKDSSTSESEDDGYKNQQRFSFNMPTQISKYSSTSESEDDFGRRMHSSARQFQTDISIKRKLESEDESSSVSKKKTKTEFKTPSSFHTTELSGSESEDRSSSERSVVNEPFGNFASSHLNANAGVYNGSGMRMMKKMGYVEGTGLGKHSQGRTQIVEASNQRGRRGLGLHIEGLEAENIEWDSTKEQESLEEVVTWMPKCNEEPVLSSELYEWLKEGDKKETIDDETEFCDPDLLDGVLKAKSVFDKLSGEEMLKARTRSNPYETIRGGIFLNRAAMKMANMDYAFDFMFTDPKDEAGDSLIPPGELLYFADICAGPGGFSEYILWRKKWKCKGFGFTLKGPNDFRLDDFFAGSPETFEPYYGVGGIDGNGNIYCPENLLAFQNFVMEGTDQKGVYFVMADGGFSVEGQENIQEILSKRIYLCQFLCALLILRTGGHFVCKLFDLFTLFSIGLVYLMYRVFEQVSIFKPNTSRPANSERYIVCKWRKDNTKDICDYMFDINFRLNEISQDGSLKNEVDIIEVVPLDVIKSDEKFFNYICESNNIIAERQILHLRKIQAFAKNPSLHDFKQNDFRQKCLDLWKVPNTARVAPPRGEPSSKFNELMKGERIKIQSNPELLNISSLSKLDNIFDFKAVVCGELTNQGLQTFYIGMGRSIIYYFDAKNNKWCKCDVKLELPSGTLFYGEFVFERKGEGKSQRKITSLHVIDALILGGIDVRNMSFEDRMTQTRMLAKAVSKPSRSDYTPLRVKQVWPLTQIKHVLARLCMKHVKGGGSMERLCFNIDDTEDTKHFIPEGMLILKTVPHPWIVAFSKSHQQQYYFNTKTNASVFEAQRSNEAIANFKTCFEKRMFWNWEKNVSLLELPSEDDDKSLVHGHTLWKFVRRRYQVITKLQPNF